MASRLGRAATRVERQQRLVLAGEDEPPRAIDGEVQRRVADTIASQDQRAARTPARVPPPSGPRRARARRRRGGAGARAAAGRRPKAAASTRGGAPPARRAAAGCLPRHRTPARRPSSAWTGRRCPAHTQVDPARRATSARPPQPRCASRGPMASSSSRLASPRMPYTAPMASSWVRWSAGRSRDPIRPAVHARPVEPGAPSVPPSAALATARTRNHAGLAARQSPKCRQV